MSHQNGPLRCMDCGVTYASLGLDLVLPDQQWNAIAPEGGILCANCICHRASRLGGAVVQAWVDQIVHPLDTLDTSDTSSPQEAG